jgi:ABC-type antimicrobial peptide transport system permease subunit
LLHDASARWYWEDSRSARCCSRQSVCMVCWSSPSANVPGEIAVRLALGAQQVEILRMVIGHGLKLVAFGLVLGVGISYGVGRTLASLLYQTESHDIVTFGTVSIVLFLIAVIACALPAYRASRVEPMGVLRTE